MTSQLGPDDNLSLNTIGENPYVGETPPNALDSWLTPNSLFYVRSQFNYPEINDEEWSLKVIGPKNSKDFSLENIKKLPKRTLTVTLECAGNNRADLDPSVSGNQFNNGAVSNAVWAGTPLNSVLEKINLNQNVIEILFEGADIGTTSKGKDPEPYLRSLPLELATHPDTLLAYEMNGAVLPMEHGYPIRLIVPGWYGMAHVKWLSKITTLTEPFSGYFQGEKYVLKYRDGTKSPVQEMQIKSTITSPDSNETINCCSNYFIKGHAWSGRSNIDKVEISVDQGQTWSQAKLEGPLESYSWQPWTYEWIPKSPGRYTILSRATNDKGTQQPSESIWNELGYQVNGIKSISVQVVE